MLVKSRRSSFASVVGFCLWMTALCSAQVTGSGTSGTVPVFTSTGVPATVGNSPISVSGSNVGIGTTNPSAALDVMGSGNYTPSQIHAYFTAGASDDNFRLAAINGSGTSVNTEHAWFGMTYGGSETNMPGISFVRGSNANGWMNFQAMGTTVLSVGGSGTGNVGIGTTSPGAKLEVSGNVKVSGSGSSITFPDSSTQTTAWTGVLCGGDYAESVDVTGDRNHYEAGDVLVIDPNNPEGFTKTAEPYSTGVAGVYSTKPGVVGRKSTDLEKAKTEIPMAMVGIVPTKVSAENGPIRRGDLLVTSSSFGYAMKGTDRSQISGAIVGKALGSLTSGTGVIDVLVSLQ